MRSLRRRSVHGEAGFTLIELMVAMMIVMLVSVGMVGVFVSTLSQVGLAKQRQQATALATRTMEQLRALSLDAVSTGLASSDVAGDPNINSATLHFRPTFDASIDELLVTSASQTQAPLNPHTAATVVDGVSYTVRTYVTKATVSATSRPAFAFTVIVTWSSGVTKGATKLVVQRSQMYAPPGCLSSATHPYSGPCQPSYVAVAGLTAGSLTVSADNTGLPAPQFGADTAVDVLLPSLSARTEIEQIVSSKASVETSSVHAQGSALGGSQALALNDSDPSTTTAAMPPQTTPAQPNGSLSISGAAGTLTTSTTTADVGNVAAQVASASPGCENIAGVALGGSPGQPCASGKITTSGGSSKIVANLSSVAGAPFTVAEVSGSTTKTSVYRQLASGTTVCPTAIDAGCAAGQASRQVALVTSGGLPTSPTLVLSTGTLYGGAQVALTSLDEIAKAEAGLGVGALAPVGASQSMTRTGQLHFYDDTGVLREPTISAAAAAPIPPLHAYRKYMQGGIAVEINLTSTIKVAAVGVGTATGTVPCTAPPASAAPPGPCIANAKSPSTLIVTSDYVVSIAGVTTAHFTCVTDLGTVVAQASFKGASA